MARKLKALRIQIKHIRNYFTERIKSWTCPECGIRHDRNFNAACNIKEFGLKTLLTERGKVKPVDCPTVDERPRVLKSRGRKVSHYPRYKTTLFSHFPHLFLYLFTHYPILLSIDDQLPVTHTTQELS